MFSLLSGCFEFMTHKEEMHLLIVGLDRSGKTTLLERLKGAYTDSAGLEPERILPTVGLNIARFQVGPVPVVAWDLGGAAPLRSIWEKYYHESQAVLYLIDAADVARVEEAKLVMDRLLGNRDLHGVPLLVLANKQDLPGALSAVELKGLLGLGKFDTSRPVDVQPCSALSGERLGAAVEWLVEQAKRSGKSGNGLRRRT